MRKRKIKQQLKVRRQQQRETIKNLHRKLNDQQFQKNHLEGMRDAHLDELSRVAGEKEKEMTAKYQPQISQLKAQLTDKDVCLSREIDDALASKKELQTLQQQMAAQSNQLAVISARDAAHGEELERVRKEVEERTRADYIKQLEEANAKVEKAQAAEKEFKQRMAAGHELAAELKESMAPIRPRKNNRLLNLNIQANTKEKINLLRKVKLITAGEISKAVDYFLVSWILPKMVQLEILPTKNLNLCYCQQEEYPTNFALSGSFPGTLCWPARRFSQDHLIARRLTSIK